MQKIQKLQRKIIAYVMISLMVINLFWSPGERHVKAEPLDGEVVDEQAPGLSISGAEEDGHYNSDVTLTFMAEDENLADLTGDNYTLKKVVDGKETDSKELEWKVDDSGCFAEAVLTVTEEGAYTFELSMKDVFGNETKDDEIKRISFLIDKTAPELKDFSIEKESDSILNEKDVVSYLNGEAKINFTVGEINSNGTIITTNTLLDGNTVQSNKYDMENMNPYSNSELFSEEGTYLFTISARDKAGNETREPLKECQFVIDKTAPEITIKAEAKQFIITAIDNNNDLSSYVISVEKTKDNKEKVVEEIKDTASSWEEFNDRAIYVLDCTEEANYKITVVGKDKAGNESNRAEAEYNVDITKPVIKQSTSLENDACYRAGVELKGYIKEFNFAETKASIEVLRTLDGKTSKDLEEKIALKEEIQSFDYSFETEGEYQVTIKAEDKDKNEADPLVLHFVIDKTSPELSISGITDDSKTKEDVKLTFQAIDRNHNFSEYSIHAVRKNANGEEEVMDDIIWPDHSAMEKDQVKVTSNQIVSYGEEGYYEITFKGKDRAGNIAAEKKISFLIDHTAPTISKISYSDANGLIMEKYGIICSNKAVVVEFNVQDSLAGVDEKRIYVTRGSAEDRTENSPIYIAHKTIGNRYYVIIPTDLNVAEYDEMVTIWANDILGNESFVSTAKVVYNNDFPNIVMESDVDYTKWTNQDVTFHTQVSDVKSGLKEVIYRIDGKEVKRVTFDSHMTSYEYDLTATKTCDKVSGYAVSVEVTNNAGTTGSMDKQVFIDKDKPKVTLSGIDYGEHFKEDKTFYTEVQDVSYSDTKTVYVITRTLDGKTYDVPAAVFHSKKQNDSCKRTMTAEGLYKIYAVTTDSAGNKSISNTLSFVIDKTAPRLSVSGTGKDSMNGTPVSIDFACVESFFATNEIFIDVERTLDGNTVKENIKGFPKNAKKASMRHTFSEDGTYVVTISATDKAGNVAESKSITFSVDCTKPEIRISGTDNYEQWNKAVNLRISVTESYYAGSNIQISGTRTDIDGNVHEIAISDFKYTGKLSSVSRLFEEDGKYALEIVAKDEAGNREHTEVHFVIDCTDPEINKVDDWSNGYYQEFKLADSLEEVFKDLTVLSYHLLLNGVEYNGTDVINEEGKYNLYVDAKDELGHISRKNIEFIIDHTAPKVIFTGAKDGQTLHDKGEVVLALTNSEDEVTAVRMNGTDYGPDVRRLFFDRYGSYRIEVDCQDKAGNAVTRSIYFVYNNPIVTVLMFAGVGAFIIAMCVGIVAETRKKRKKGKTDESSSI